MAVACLIRTPCLVMMLSLQELESIALLGTPEVLHPIFTEMKGFGTQPGVFAWNRSRAIIFTGKGMLALVIAESFCFLSAIFSSQLTVSMVLVCWLN